MSYHCLTEKSIHLSFEAAKDQYQAVGVDPEEAVEAALKVPLSLHCWQADDVNGLEHAEDDLTGGGIFATGSHPGRARNGAELRADYEQVLRLLPGVHRMNFHACYAEAPKGTDRDELTFDHMKGWVEWAKSQGIHLDGWMDRSFQAYPQKLVNVTVPDRARRKGWADCAPLADAVHAAEASMGESGRILVRASGTEPVLRVMVEAERQETVDQWTGQLAALADQHLNAA